MHPNSFVSNYWGAFQNRLHLKKLRFNLAFCSLMRIFQRIFGKIDINP